MKRQLSIAFLAAIMLNALFFLLIGWAWYHATHPVLKKAAQTSAPQVLATSIVSGKAQIVKPDSMAIIVTNAFHHKVTIQRTFAAPGHLNGLVLALKDMPTETFIAYFDPAKKLLYLGQVINAKGQNTTLKATQTYLSDPEKPIIIAAFQKVDAVVTGSKTPKHTITILIDPNSPYFRALYQNFLLDTVQQGLQIRWILVNYLKPMGPNLAGWILSSQSPSKQLMEVANTPLKHWATLKVPTLKQPIVDMLRKHWNLMQSYHLVPGPVTLFRASGHNYVIKGLVGPESFDQILPDILK